MPTGADGPRTAERHKADVLDLLESGDEARAMWKQMEAERDRYRAALEAHHREYYFGEDNTCHFCGESGEALK